MALFDTLGGVVKAYSGGHIYLIGSGLTPGQTYYLFFTTGNINQDGSAANNKVANANGNLYFDITQGGTQSFTYVLHDDPSTASNNVIHRVGNPLNVQWAPESSTFPRPVYGTPAPLGPVVAGHTIVSLQWGVGIECESRISSITYQVRSSSVAPPPNPASILVSGLTVLGYTVTGLVNGNPHWYMIRTTFKYLDDLITPVNELVTPVGPFDSNVVTATPKALRESWGVIAA